MLSFPKGICCCLFSPAASNPCPIHRAACDEWAQGNGTHLSTAPTLDPGEQITYLSKMRMTVLASGSKGNSTVIATPRTRILVDAGLSCRELLRRMAMAGEDPAALDAILITHEHQDHVAGLAVLARRLGIPVYFTEPTHRAWVRMLTPRTTMTYAKWLDHLQAEKLARAQAALEANKVPTYAPAATPGAPCLASETWAGPPATHPPEALEAIARSPPKPPPTSRSDDLNVTPGTPGGTEP